MAATLLEMAQEGVWYERSRYEEAEQEYYAHLAQQSCGGHKTEGCTKQSAQSTGASHTTESSV